MSESVFEHDSLVIDVQGAAFAPLSEINEARRAAVAKLEAGIAATWHRPARPTPAMKPLPVVDRSARTMRLAVNCWRLENVRAALEAGAKEISYSGLKVGGLQPKWDEEAVAEAAQMATEHGARLWLASGMIQKDWEVEALRAAVRQVRASPRSPASSRATRARARSRRKKVSPSSPTGR